MSLFPALICDVTAPKRCVARWGVMGGEICPASRGFVPTTSGRRRESAGVMHEASAAPATLA